MSLILRRPRPADAATIAEQLASAPVQPDTLQLPYANEALWRERLSAPQVAGSAELMLLAEEGGEVLGFAGLHPAGPQLRRRHVMMLGISVVGSAQGRGIGHALTAALLDYADNWGQVLRVELTVFHDNTRAIRLYERHGFVTEGRHRAYSLRGGEYADVLSMARLHPKPPSWDQGRG